MVRVWLFGLRVSGFVCMLVRAQCARTYTHAHACEECSRTYASTRPQLVDFLGQMTRHLSLCPIEYNCNMPVYNWVLHKYFNDVLYTGFPWNRYVCVRACVRPCICVCVRACVFCMSIMWRTCVCARTCMYERLLFASTRKTSTHTHARTSQSS